MGTPKKADWREERRKRSWDLKELAKTAECVKSLEISTGLFH